MKYLVLGFKNAKFFAKPKFSKDRSYDSITNIHLPRTENDVDPEPIMAGHVSNMLHVLFCERPKSKKRYSCYDRLSKFDEMAQSSFIRYTTFIRDGKDGLDKYPTQKMVMQKAMYNAHSKPLITWGIINDYLGDSLFGDLLLVIEGLGFTPSSHTITEVCELIDIENEQVKELFDRFEKGGRTAAVQWFRSRGGVQTITCNPQTRHTETKGIDNVTAVDGQIAVLVDESDIEILRERMGTPTILDGGLVYVVGMVDYDVFNSEGYGPIFEPIKVN